MICELYWGASAMSDWLKLIDWHWPSSSLVNVNQVVTLCGGFREVTLRLC